MELTCTRPTSEAADGDLAKRARSGDRAAYDALFARHHARAYNLALRLQGDRDEAADIAQAAFVRAYRALGDLRDGQAFLGWLYRIVVNLVRDRAKQRKRKPWVALLDLSRPEGAGDGGAEPVEFADRSLDPSRVVAERHRDRALLDAVAALPLEFREVVVLHHLHQMDVKDIADAVGVPEGTVKSRLGRARQRLRAALGEWLDVGEGER